MNALSTLLISLALINQAPNKNWEKVAVIKVVASDTVVVDAADNPMLWVTLLGVGTPESDDPRKDAHLVGKGDPNLLESWLPTSTDVWMERRGESNGRPVVMLYRRDDQFCLNALLVKSGAAFAREQVAFPEFSKLVSLETEAKKQRLGLWEGLEAPPAIDVVKPQPDLVAVKGPVRPQPVGVAVRDVVKPPPVEVGKGDEDEDEDEVDDVIVPQEPLQAIRNPVAGIPNGMVQVRPRRRFANQEAARAQSDMMMGAMMSNYLRYDTGYYGGMLNPNSYNGYYGMLNPTFNTNPRFYPNPFAGMWNYAYGYPPYGYSYGYGPYGAGAPVYGYFVPVNPYAGRWGAW